MRCCLQFIHVIRRVWTSVLQGSLSQVLNNYVLWNENLGLPRVNYCRNQCQFCKRVMWAMRGPHYFIVVSMGLKQRDNLSTASTILSTLGVESTFGQNLLSVHNISIYCGTKLSLNINFSTGPLLCYSDDSASKLTTVCASHHQLNNWNGQWKNICLRGFKPGSTVF